MDSYTPQRIVDVAALVFAFANLAIGALLSIIGLFSLLVSLAFWSGVSSIPEVLIVAAFGVGTVVPILALGNNLKFLGGGPTSHLIKATIGNVLCCIAWIIAFSW